MSKAPPVPSTQVCGIGRIEVFVDHPMASGYLDLAEWIEMGPGLRDVAPTRARDKENGSELPLSVIPLHLRNSPLSRFLIEEGILEDPWRHLAYRRKTQEEGGREPLNHLEERIPYRGIGRSSFFDFESLASMSCQSRWGTVLAVESARRTRIEMGGKKVFRLFWQEAGQNAWQELPLALRFGSIWRWLSGRWPPRKILKLGCEASGVEVLSIDPPVGRKARCWICVAE